MLSFHDLCARTDDQIGRCCRFIKTPSQDSIAKQAVQSDSPDLEVPLLDWDTFSNTIKSPLLPVKLLSKQAQAEATDFLVSKVTLKFCSESCMKEYVRR